jgi:hypothetical protein
MAHLYKHGIVSLLLFFQHSKDYLNPACCNLNGYEECFEYHCVHGHYPLRDLSNMAFRVHMVELEYLGDCIYRKHGDYRLGGTLIEADGCTSLKEVCKSVCVQGTWTSQIIATFWSRLTATSGLTSSST